MTSRIGKGPVIRPSPSLACGLILGLLALIAGPVLAMTAEELAVISSAAERGSAASQVMLALAYLNGDRGLDRNVAAAARWFEQAAIQGNSYAEEKLGDLYEQGLGVARNPRLAADWREKAANRGNVQAQLKLGKMYLDGAGIEPDRAKALFWLRRAATEGDAEAQYLLGTMYHYGAGVDSDAAAARMWFEKSARLGNEGAIYFLHLIESIGFAIEERWYHRLPALHQVAEDGDVEAQYQLAQRYEHGAGGETKNMMAALHWYRRAAAGGHVMAMRALSHIYAHGAAGVPSDPKASRDWAEKAESARR